MDCKEEPDGEVLGEQAGCRAAGPNAIEYCCWALTIYDTYTARRWRGVASDRDTFQTNTDVIEPLSSTAVDGDFTVRSM